VRFDSAIAYLAKNHKRPLSKYEIVKLHVLMDALHVIETGNAILGGTLQPWTEGPVVEEAWGRLDDWCARYDYTGEPPENFAVIAQGKLRFFSPICDADVDDFSASELDSMERAWTLLMSMMNGTYQGYLKARDYFHSEDTFLGRAFNQARRERRDIDWHDIIDAYDAIHGTNHEHIKVLISA
jgi:hypothetical protein